MESGVELLDILVLGPVRASTDGCDHPLGGTKQRGLFARLVVARGRPLAPEQLIDDLWDGSPPRNPAHALQARISRLRAVVPVNIELRDGGYVLDPTGVQTDSARFERLIEQGGWLVSDGDLAQAAECFHNALELWRGSAFTGLGAITALRLEAVRLERLRAAAVADRIDLDLSLGRSCAVLPELHALVEEYPYYERHWGQLMTALYIEGRAQEALTVFSHARSAFAEGLGVEPSSDLGKLHIEILRERPPRSLLRLPAPVPVPVLSEPDPRPNDRDVLTTRRLTSNQPDQLVDLLRHHRSLILTGPAGIGKTHLLRAVGSRFHAQHCTAPVLTATALSQSVPLGVFAGAGESLPQGWMSAAALIDHFTRHRSSTVLLVDNVNLLDEASLFVVTQLIRTSRLPAVLTSCDLTQAPEEVRALYDSGELTEIAIDPLTPAGAGELAAGIVNGPLSPAAGVRIYAAAKGNPLHLREVITASLDEGRLVRTGDAWELQGAPASTPRLTQLVGARFAALDEAGLEAAAKVAIAGELPATALAPAELRALTRAGVVEYSAYGWLGLAHPLDGEVVRSMCSAALWRDLTGEVVGVLLAAVSDQRPTARRRAHILALELSRPLDVPATLAVARHALGTFDDRLALRAAQAVAAQVPTDPEAYRIAGLAASALGMSDQADAHFDRAAHHATTDTDLAALALARARHLGMRHHDAAGALAVIQSALATVEDSNEADHLRRDGVRWATIAGQTSEAVRPPDGTSDAAVAMGLITVAMAGVITGPLSDTEAILAQLRRMPAETLELVPGASSLIELTEIMALSNTGDVLAAGRRLEQKIASAQEAGEESLGVWEYALGLSELLSGDAERSHALAMAAVSHLQWRDTAGLLPAARALAVASARATGRQALALTELHAIAPTAEYDPKVVMLLAWADAWQEHVEGRGAGASRILIDAARWLLTAQHHYFAGMLAHCAVRVGQDVPEAAAILDEAERTAGGGLLQIFARHAAATVAGDPIAMDAIASNAWELGMATTTADTWLYLTRRADDGDVAGVDARRWHVSVERLREETPAMALWAPT